MARRKTQPNRCGLNFTNRLNYCIIKSMKNPNEMSVVELKALIFDLTNDKEVCLQILQKKLAEEARLQALPTKKDGK